MTNNKYYHATEIFNRVFNSGGTLTGKYDTDAAILNAVFDETKDALNIVSKVELIDTTINNLVVNENLTVIGDLYVSGTSYSVISEDVLVEETHLTLNFGEIGSGVTNKTSGLIIDRGQATDFLIEFDEITDTFRVGFSGDTKEVALNENLTTEISSRISGDDSLMVVINNLPGVSGIMSLSTSIQNETSYRIQGDVSLSTLISSIPVFDDSSLSTSIQNEISDRISGDTSLSLAILNIPTGSTYDDTSLSTALSNEIVNRISGDTSLSTAILNVNPTSLSIALVNEISDRISGDTSLSTLISSIPVFDDSSLSTSIQNEISDRIVGDISLSTSIYGKVSLSGTSQTINSDIVIHGNLIVSGSTISLSAQTMEVEDNFIVVNAGELGHGISLGQAGIQVDRGLDPDYFFEFKEDSQTFRVGESGTTQAVATREDVPLNNGLAIWDATENMFITNTTIVPSLSTSAQQPWIDIDRCGFVENSNLALSFDDSTMILTLSALTSTWSYFRTGIKYTITGNKTISIPNVNGTYFIFINNTTGTLESGTTPWTLQDATLPTAIIKYNNTLTPKYQLAYELHTSKIDRREHLYLHSTRGTQYVNGGQLTGPDVNLANASNTNATSCFGISATTIADEDIFLSLAALTRPDGSTTTGYTCYTRTGSTTYIWSKSVVPYTYGANSRIMYDVNGTMTEAPNTNNRWYNWYLIYTNFQGDSRYALLPGRSSFTSLALAQAEDIKTFDFTGFPIEESVIAYQFSWRYDTNIDNLGKVKLAATPKKVNVSTITSAGSAGSADHNTLVGLQGGTTDEFYHLTNSDYLNVTGLTVTLSSLLIVDSSLSTSILNEISDRISGDISLATLISNIPVYDDSSLSTSIVNEISNRISGDISLSTSILNEISDRIAADNSLSTSILNNSGSTYDDSSLSTAISNEISNRILGDLSLSSTIGNLSGVTTMPYSAVTYNLSTGNTITTTGTTTIVFNTTDMYFVDISGNTTSGITFDFSGGTIGKTLTMIITNSGVGNTTKCVFNATSCKTFGAYDNTKTNAVSVLCKGTNDPKYWVVIANT